MIPWHKNDELFKKELTEGFAWQRLPALYFELHGFKTHIPEFDWRESIADSVRYKDSYDVLVEGRFKIEVKSRNYNFTSPDDFPFDSIFVENVSGYEQRDNPPFAYVNISKPTGAMLFVGGNKNSTWKIESAFDRTRKIKDEWYTAPRSKLRTMDNLIKAIKARMI